MRLPKIKKRYVATIVMLVWLAAKLYVLSTSDKCDDTFLDETRDMFLRILTVNDSSVIGYSPDPRVS